jgi:hypothetical protein
MALRGKFGGLFRDVGAAERELEENPTTQTLQDLGGLGGPLLGMLGGREAMVGLAGVLNERFAEHIQILAAIENAVKASTPLRYPLLWPAASSGSSGTKALLPLDDGYEALAIVNTGATTIYARMGGDVALFPIPSASGGVPTVAWFPVGGVREVELSGQTTTIYGVAINRTWPLAGIGLEPVGMIGAAAGDGVPVGSAQSAGGVAYALAGMEYGWAGTTPGTVMQRIPYVVKNIAAQAVTAGTPVTIWTPAAGRKFRFMGGALSLTVAGSVIIKDAATEILRTPLLLAGTGIPLPPMGNGILSAAANNVCAVDVSASGSVSGFVFGTEE